MNTSKIIKMFNFSLLFLFCYGVTSTTYVALTFDDGYDTHHEASLLLDDYDVQATFYVNSGKINSNGRLTVDQMNDMKSRGHEIAGHTREHDNLRDYTYEEQKDQICGDRAQLREWGFDITSFAFPFGADTPEAYKILVECGFNSARDSGGLRTNTSCLLCPTAESHYPRNPYQMRSISYNKDRGTDGLKWYVTQALSHTGEPGNSGDGIIILVFHEFGNYPHHEQAIKKNGLRKFVQWLVAQNVEMTTIHNYVGGVVLPIFSDLQESLSDENGHVNIALTFDDGTSDHLGVADALQENGMTGTFFINSANVGFPGFLTLDSIGEIERLGNEIGGHTKTGPHLLQLTQEQQIDEICGDKSTLDTRYDITTIGWPYGETNEHLQAIASSCGYTLGRDVGSMYTQNSCPNCPKSLPLPLTSDIMGVRAFNVKSYHSLGDLIWQVRVAEENGNGSRLSVFVFHTIGYGKAFDPEVFEKFLTWLKPRQLMHTHVVSLREALSTPPQ